MRSGSLSAVLSQRLVRTGDGKSRVPALELIVINRGIGNLIRDEKTVQIRSSMQTGKAHGMYLLEQSLNDLVAGAARETTGAEGLSAELARLSLRRDRLVRDACRRLAERGVVTRPVETGPLAAALTEGELAV